MLTHLAKQLIHLSHHEILIEWLCKHHVQSLAYRQSFPLHCRGTGYMLGYAAGPLYLHGTCFIYITTRDPIIPSGDLPILLVSAVVYSPLVTLESAGFYSTQPAKLYAVDFKT